MNVLEGIFFGDVLAILANHNHQLSLIINLGLGRRALGDDDIIVRAGDRGGSLHEDSREGGDGKISLLQVNTEVFK